MGKKKSSLKTKIAMQRIMFGDPSDFEKKSSLTTKKTLFGDPLDFKKTGSLKMERNLYGDPSDFEEKASLKAKSHSGHGSKFAVDGSKPLTEIHTTDGTDSGDLSETRRVFFADHVK